MHAQKASLVAGGNGDIGTVHARGKIAVVVCLPMVLTLSLSLQYWIILQCLMQVSSQHPSGKQMGCRSTERVSDLPSVVQDIGRVQITL